MQSKLVEEIVKRATDDTRDEKNMRSRLQLIRETSVRHEKPARRVISCFFGASQDRFLMLCVSKQFCGRSGNYAQDKGIFLCDKE